MKVAIRIVGEAPEDADVQVDVEDAERNEHAERAARVREVMGEPKEIPLEQLRKMMLEPEAPNNNRHQLI